MLDPVRLVTDLFKEKNLSNNHLHAFTEDFLVRLSNPGLNPGGIYNQLLVDTTALYQNYYGSITNQITQEAIGKGLTMSMNMACDAVIAKLSVLQDLIGYHFGAKSDVYKEFYPRGMKQYHRATIGECGTFFARFRAIATMHLAGPYPAEMAQLTTLIIDFTKARDTQETVFSKQAGFISDRKNSRRALTRQLTKCFLRIASDNIENPVRIKAYYESRYLPIRKGKKKKKEESGS